MDESRVYKSGREDGRYVSTMGFAHHLMWTGKARLGFDPDLSRAEFKEWRGRVRLRLQELLCLPDEVPEQPAPVRLWGEEREGYRLEKWEAFPEPGSVVPFLILLPDGAGESKPSRTVMCFPGSASSKELLAGEPELRSEQQPNRHPIANQMAFHYVRAGFAAVVVENPGTAELDEMPINGQNPNTGRDKLCGELLMLGRNYVGLSVYQKLHILEWLKTRKWVDSDRITLSGHSLGTEPAMCIALLDTSVSALVFNDFLSHNRIRYTVTARPEEAWRHINPLWHVIPGLVKWFEFPDLLASLAPRPLIICEGGAIAHLEMIARAYEIVGAQKNYAYHFYPKYCHATDRRFDYVDIPEGLKQDEWFEHVNVDAPNHSFKGDVAIPWLSEHL